MSLLLQTRKRLSGAGGSLDSALDSAGPGMTRRVKNTSWWHSVNNTHHGSHKDSIMRLWLVVILSGLSSASYAGFYDGVWRAFTERPDFYVVYQKGNDLVIVDEFYGGTGWDAMTGSFISPTVAKLDFLSDRMPNTHFIVEFIDETHATMTTDCDRCEADGAVMRLMKFY